MLYIRTTLHIFFVIGLYYLWKKIDKKPNYKEYLKVSFFVGVPLGIIFDVAGFLLFKLWVYPDPNIVEYIAIFLGTYVIATPVLIEIYEYLEEIGMHIVHLRLIKKLPQWWYILILCTSCVLVVYLSIVRIQANERTMNAVELSVFFGTLLLLSDSVLHFFHFDGSITKILKGYVFVPFMIILSGIISGALWEILNVNIRLWQYQNLPLQQIHDVPIFVFIFWGTLNLTYATLAKILSRRKFIRRI